MKHWYWPARGAPCWAVIGKKNSSSSPTQLSMQMQSFIPIKSTEVLATYSELIGQWSPAVDVFSWQHQCCGIYTSFGCWDTGNDARSILCRGERAVTIAFGIKVKGEFSRFIQIWCHFQRIFSGFSADSQRILSGNRMFTSYVNLSLHYLIHTK